jgi:hypothetical protein
LRNIEEELRKNEETRQIVEELEQLRWKEPEIRDKRLTEIKKSGLITKGISENNTREKQGEVSVVNSEEWSVLKGQWKKCDIFDLMSIEGNIYSNCNKTIFPNDTNYGETKKLIVKKIINNPEGWIIRKLIDGSNNKKETFLIHKSFGIINDGKVTITKENAGKIHYKEGFNRNDWSKITKTIEQKFFLYQEIK